MTSASPCLRLTRLPVHLAAIGALLFAGALTAPRDAAARDLERQLAQASSPFVGTWTWASPRGPVVLAVSQVLPGGRPRGTFRVNAYRSQMTLQLADKASASEMAAKITGDRFVGRLSNGAVYDLRLAGGKLVGTFRRADGRGADASFVK